VGFSLTLSGQGEDFPFTLDEVKRSDAATLASELEKWSNHPRALAVAEELVRVWTERDPAAARTWALSLPVGDLREMAFSGYLQKTISTGWPDTLLEEIALAYPDPAEQEMIVGGALLHYARQFPASAMMILDENPQLFESEGAWLGLLTGLGMSDPAQATALAKMKYEAEGNAEFLLAAARGWSAEDAGAALPWLQEFDLAPAEIAPSLVDLFSDWAAQDFSGLRKWAERQPQEAGAWRDYALVALAATASATNLSLALELAGQISDPILREEEWEILEAEATANLAGSPLSDPNVRTLTGSKAETILGNQSSEKAIAEDLSTDGAGGHVHFDWWWLAGGLSLLGAAGWFFREKGRKRKQGNRIK
jgi:hypothetical protein